MRHVTIIGGGIAGLATAFYLQQKSEGQVGYTLIERAARLGGKIITEQADGFIIEGGPDSFITQKPWGLQLCRDLGLEDRLIPTNDDRRNIYIYTGGRLVPFPGGFRLTVPTEVVPFALSPLISPFGKLRMGLDMVIPPRRDASDESLADFLRRRLGQEALDKIGGPMMAGIYVADPEKLSLQSTFPMFAQIEQKYGSLIKGMRAARQKSRANGNGKKPPAMFNSLKGGMLELVETLAQQLTGDIRTGCAVTHLQRSADGFIVTLESGQTLATDAVVLAVPAYVAAELVADMDADLAAQLRQIRYVSTATVSLAFDKHALTHDLNGFGFMISQRAERQILACTWTSTKFNHRAPADGALLRAFVGGDGKGHLVDLPDEDLIQLVRSELQTTMGISAPPHTAKIFRWPDGNPQYEVGHLDRVAAMEARAAQIPGLHLTGSAWRGIGIPDCVKSALATVDVILT